MFSKYEDVILIVLILVVVVLVAIIINLKKDVDKLKSNDRTTHKRLNALDFANNRVLKVIESNASSITFFRKQMNQVHIWLGEVLGVSNLIRNERGEKDSSIVIEELREAVKWAKEKAERQINETDYYKGD
ncbi:hypothetical protein [Microcoleus sp. MON2_D5]|uniref:hypothetical protein n=1 Tax=Microcoleus sp. MON2_D5 TaxID=2818833 RepID=UPI002FD61F6C